MKIPNVDGKRFEARPPMLLNLRALRLGASHLLIQLYWWSTCYARHRRCNDEQHWSGPAPAQGLQCCTGAHIKRRFPQKYEVTNLVKYSERLEQEVRGLQNEGTCFEAVIILSHPSEEM